MAFHRFCHLHVHSDFTMAEGASKVTDLVKRAKIIGCASFALTDVNNIYGGMEFSSKAFDNGIHPIIGAEVVTEYGNCVLLAMNEEGYVNLTTLVSKCYAPVVENGQRLPKDEPVLSISELLNHSEGVILLTGSRTGFMWKLLETKRKDKLDTTLKSLKSVYKDRLYIEVCRNGDLTEKQMMIEKQIIDYAYNSDFDITCNDGKKYGNIPLVAATEVFYSSVARHDAFVILQAIRDKQFIEISSENEMIHNNSDRFHMRTYEEMQEMFKDIPFALENTFHIASRCHVMVEKRNPLLPAYESAFGRTEAEELTFQSKLGLDYRLEQYGIPESKHKEYMDRLDFELSVIIQMGFPGYFLIVSDFINWSKNNNIPVGPGRGSGAGSIVAWALKITDLDPIRWGLLFERFLNPERVSMPDFDIDFCQDRRHEVIEYVRQKYGYDKVSQIATFGVIKSKTAVKDVGRVINHDSFGDYRFDELNQITKKIPMNGAEPVTLKEAVGMLEFQDVLQSAKNKSLIEYASMVEGLYRNNGAHAAGVIITDRPLQKLVPVSWDYQNDMPVCQFNMKSAENAGLVKFDFLGLKTLSIIQKTVNLLNQKDIYLDLSVIPLDDKETYDLLADGQTNGVFQFESQGMIGVLKRMKPDRFEDLIAIVSLYRPGPMDQIPDYIAVKQGLQKPDYMHPLLEPILKETNGILIYQEQVMQAAQVLSGYSLGGADLLRRAMGKKIKEEMEKQRATFIEGAMKNGVPRDLAGHIFDKIDKFAGYGFNKSHAAAYALIAYQTAYLKAHYPIEFYASYLSYVSGEDDEVYESIEEVKEMNVRIMPVCVQRSERNFNPEVTVNQQGESETSIRFGFIGIEGFSDEMKDYLKEREKNGPYLSVFDFCKRTYKYMTPAQMKSVARLGGFNIFMRNRKRCAAMVEWYVKKLKKDDKENNKTLNMFGEDVAPTVIPPEIAGIQDYDGYSRFEHELIGFNVSVHPLEEYETRLKHIKYKRRLSVTKWMHENTKGEVRGVKLCGIIRTFTQFVSKKGYPYFLIDFIEKDDDYTLLYFPKRDASVGDLNAKFMSICRENKLVVVIADFVFKEKKRSNVKERIIYGENDEVHDVEYETVETTYDPEEYSIFAKEVEDAEIFFVPSIPDVYTILFSSAHCLKFEDDACVKNTIDRIQPLIEAHIEDAKAEGEESYSVRLIEVLGDGREGACVYLKDKYKRIDGYFPKIKSVMGVLNAFVSPGDREYIPDVVRKI